MKNIIENAFIEILSGIAQFHDGGLTYDYSFGEAGA